MTFNPWVDADSQGRRVVMDGLLLYCTWQMDIATAQINGENMARLFNNVAWYDRDGVRGDLTGEALRVYSGFHLGALRMHEHADEGTGTDSTGIHWIYLPFSKSENARPQDTAIAADQFKKLVITPPTNATLDLGSSAVTIDSLTYKIWADVHEEDEVELKVRDMVGETVMETDTQGGIDIGGGYLCEMLAYQSGDVLTDMAAWTAHTIKPSHVLPDEMTDDEIRAFWRIERQAGDNSTTPGDDLTNDPIAAERVQVVFLPFVLDRKVKLTDRPWVPSKARIVATSTETTPRILHRHIAARDQTNVDKLARARGVDFANGYVKTPQGKAPAAAFDKLQPFLPIVGRKAA